MNNYRKLNTIETEIFNKLLERDFPGADEIKDQIKNCEAKIIRDYNDNWGSIEIRTNSKKMADVESRIPVQGILYDSDGVPIEVFLHVIGGFINELEIVKVGQSPMKTIPDVKNMKVVLYSEVEK